MSGAILVAVALSLVSAVAYASAAVVQERLAARTPHQGGLFALLGHGTWWWAVGLNATGAMLHVAALTYGPLTVVQPLGALTLVAAVPLGARRAGRQVSRGEWRGTAFTLAGLAVILLTAAGTAPAETLTLPGALGVSAVAMALVALLTRPRHGDRPGLRHAAASGITSGVASALTQTVTVAATARGTHALPMWQVGGVALLVAAFAASGLLLSQRAYEGGLGAPLAVLTLANPVAASAIGLILLGERLQGGVLGILAAAVGAVLAARGVVLLTRDTAPPAALSVTRPSVARPSVARPEPVREPARIPQPVSAGGVRRAGTAVPVAPLVSDRPVSDPPRSEATVPSVLDAQAAARLAVSDVTGRDPRTPVALLPGLFATVDLPGLPGPAPSPPEAGSGTDEPRRRRHGRCRA